MEPLEPCALLVGTGNGAAAVENGMAVPQKGKQSYPVTQQPHSWENTQQGFRHLCTVFAAILFTVVKMLKQTKCPLRDGWISKTSSIHTMDYYPALKKEGNPATFSSMAGPCVRHAE